MIFFLLESCCDRKDFFVFIRVSLGFREIWEELDFLFLLFLKFVIREDLMRGAEGLGFYLIYGEFEFGI